jgi:hypothetical protein
VVLASLNTARAKGADAAIKSNLANLRAQAALYYDNNSSSYVAAATCTVSNLGVVGGAGCPVGLTSDTTFLNGVKAAAAAAGATVNVNSSTSAWAVFAPLKSVTGTWCVDSIGTAASSSATVASALAC